MKHLICKIAKKIYDKGLAPGTSGNISCRLGEKVLITASGTCFGELTVQDVITTDLKGNILEGKKIPSSEKFMHYEIYKLRPDVKCIIHAHPPKATALGVMGKDLKAPLIAEAVVTLGEIPLVKYETPSSNELAGYVAEKFKDHDAVLMSNHGATVCGNELYETFYKLETLEFLSEIRILTEMTDMKREIPKDKLDELMKIREKKYGTMLKL